MTEHEKREMAVKGLEYCVNETHCDIYCPYWNDDNNCRVHMEMDALALLKAQEPVEPILKREGWNKYHNDYVCPVCDQELVYEQNYCSECGRAVKWE